MQLRHLDYLVILARERHFGRAAEACGITQSTLSAAIRQLEEEIGAPIVERDNRFRDFTAEGNAVVQWARRIRFEREALDERLSALKGGLSGRLRLAVIPVGLPTVALLTTPFHRSHPGVRLTVTSQTSVDIQRGLDDFRFEAGITYLDNERLRGVRSTKLYQERYILLTPERAAPAGRSAISWREAAELPLCLLTPEMQNRRILDAIFAEVGAKLEPRIETDSVMALCSHIRHGGWSTVLPHSFIWVFGLPPGTRAMHLVAPERSHAIGLVVRDVAPSPPLVAALEDVAGSLTIQEDIDRGLAVIGSSERAI